MTSRGSDTYPGSEPDCPVRENPFCPEKPVNDCYSLFSKPAERRTVVSLMVVKGRERMSMLSGLKIVEFEGIGPGPFCGMLLADLGAEVIAIERAGGLSAGQSAVFRRGKKSIVLDLKDDDHKQAAIKIATSADAIIEGFRPGVMERLGLGPTDLQKFNRKLIYGRLTGWGQTGPLSQAAGHDVNYVGLCGAAWYAGDGKSAPLPPPTLVGDVGGGALYLAIGILAAVIKARETGEGAVIDAAIVDGAAHMMNLLMSLRAAAGGLPDERGHSMLDGAHFYTVYRCSDDEHISVGSLEPQFYSLLLEKLDLKGDIDFIDQHKIEKWPENKAKLATIFASKPLNFWTQLLEGTDVCFAPVLSPEQARQHPHIAAREIYRDVGGVLQTAAAPRFNGEAPADPKPPAQSGADAREVLMAVGFSSIEVDQLVASS